MKVRREDRYKGKGADQDTSGIRLAVTAPYSVVMIITEG